MDVNNHPGIMYPDGHANAFLGTTIERESGEEVGVFSMSKIIKNLMDDDLSEEALEYYEYNILSAYIGPKTRNYWMATEIFVPRKLQSYGMKRI